MANHGEDLLEQQKLALTQELSAIVTPDDGADKCAALQARQTFSLSHQSKCSSLCCALMGLIEEREDDHQKDGAAKDALNYTIRSAICDVLKSLQREKLQCVIDFLGQLHKALLASGKRAEPILKDYDFDHLIRHLGLQMDRVEQWERSFNNIRLFDNEGNKLPLEVETFQRRFSAAVDCSTHKRIDFFLHQLSLLPEHDYNIMLDHLTYATSEDLPKVLRFSIYHGLAHGSMHESND